MTIHTEYITNEKGIETAVKIPIDEWRHLFEEYNNLKQYTTLHKGIKDALHEVQEIEQGRQPTMTLGEFLNECGDSR